MRAPAFLIILIILIVNTNSYALQKFERVTVTGSKTDRLQLQGSYGAELRKEDLENFNIFHADDVWDFIPNLNTAGGSNRIRFIQIRGVGERSEFDSVPTNSVGYYYDHIDLSGISGVVATYDTTSIQVLKGPQSHLFGDSSIGGNILVSSTWEEEKKTSVWAGFGSQNRSRVGAKTQVSLSESLMFKVGVQNQESDGFIKNTFLNKDTNERSELFTTAGLSYVNKVLDIRTSHIYADQNNGYDVWSTTAEKYKTRSDRPGRDAQETWGHSLELTSKLTEKAKLIFITSISDSNILYSFDEDWGNNADWNQVPGWNTNYDYHKIYDRDRRHLHTKIIYQRSIKSGFLNMGLHYTNRNDDSVITSYNDGLERKTLNSDYDSKHYAYFAGFEKKYFENLKLSLNARIERQQIGYSDSNAFNASPNSNLFGFSASLNQKINNHNFIFTLSRGFKGAGFNPEINLETSQQFYSPESLLNHELAWLFSNNSFSSKLTVFYMDRDNQQIQTSSQDDPNDPSDFTVFIDNAAKSENYGLEAETFFFKDKNINLNLSLGLLKARFKNYQLEGQDYSGRELAHAPLYSFAITTVVKATPKLSFNLNLTGRDEFYFSNSHNQKSSSYVILGSGAQYRPFKNTKISIWGRNILNKTYALRGFYFGNEPPNFDAKLYTQAAPPLEYGIDLNIVF
jgi:outer membrane receptor protein involved in Fe transport